MTKRELLARLARDPIVIERVANLSYYRIALHFARASKDAILVGLTPVAGVLLVEDYGQVYARVNGKTVKLAPLEVEVIVSRLRRIFARGGEPRTAGLGCAPTDRLEEPTIRLRIPRLR